MKGMELANITDRSWNINACIAIKGDGVKEGLNWLIETISKKNA